MSKMLKLIVVGVLFISAIVLHHKNSNRTEFTVKVASSKKQDLNGSILAAGNIAYIEDLVLRTEVTGKVEQIFVQEGQFVHKGQTILTIDSSTLQDDVVQQEASLSIQSYTIEKSRLQNNKLRQQFERRQQLMQKGLFNIEELEMLQKELEISELELKIALEDSQLSKAQLNKSLKFLEKTKIVSPIDGLVTRIPIKTGETAISGINGIAGSELVTLANTSKLYAELLVDETHIVNVELGQRAEITFSAYPEQVVNSIVEKISVVSEPKQNNKPLKYKVYAALDKVGLMLKPDMSLRAEIVIQSYKNQVLVPLEAVVNKNRFKDDAEELNIVFVMDEDKVIEKSVSTGVANDQYQIIKAGLEEGELVVVGPYETLTQLFDGASVRLE